MRLKDRLEKTQDIFQVRDNLLLAMKDVDLYYGDHHVLKGISLELYRAEMLFVTGESGAGKTSLLRILSQELLPTGGSLQWRKESHLRISQVRQQVELIDEFSLLDNFWVAYQKTVHNSLTKFESEVFELSKYFGIFNQLSLPVKKCNGGLKQILAIIRALVCRPEVLILDEPSKSLDEKNAIKVFELLSYYCQKQTLNVIWASHNRSLIKKFSGKMIHLSDGEIVYSGQACFI